MLTEKPRRGTRFAHYVRPRWEGASACPFCGHAPLITSAGTLCAYGFGPDDKPFESQAVVACYIGQCAFVEEATDEEALRVWNERIFVRWLLPTLKISPGEDGNSETYFKTCLCMYRESRLSR